MSVAVSEFLFLCDASFTVGVHEESLKSLASETGKMQKFVQVADFEFACASVFMSGV